MAGSVVVTTSNEMAYRGALVCALRIDEVFTLYLDSKRFTSDAHRERTSATIRRFRAWLSENRPALVFWRDFLPMDLIRWHSALMAKGCKRSYADGEAGIIVCVSGFVRDNWPDSARVFRVPLADRRIVAREKVYLDGSQLATLLRVADVPDMLPIMLMGFLGMGPKELFDTQFVPSDDGTTDAIRVVIGKTAHRSRLVPIPITLGRVIRFWLNTMPGDDVSPVVARRAVADAAACRLDDVFDVDADALALWTTAATRGAKDSKSLSYYVRRDIRAARDETCDPVFSRFRVYDLRGTGINLMHAAAPLAGEYVRAYVGHSATDVHGRHYADFGNVDALRTHVAGPMDGVVGAVLQGVAV